MHRSETGKELRAETKGLRIESDAENSVLSPFLSVLCYFTSVKVRRQRVFEKKSIGLENCWVSSYDQ